MTTSVFGDKSKEPTSSRLYDALGETATLLKNIEQHILDRYGELDHEWKFYSKKAGWTLALAHKGRRIFHLIPQSGLFTVIFTLGKQAVSDCCESKLPREIISSLKAAREYTEGRSIRFPVTATKDVAVVKQLIEIKMSR